MQARRKTHAVCLSEVDNGLARLLKLGAIVCERHELNLLSGPVELAGMGQGLFGMGGRGNDPLEPGLPRALQALENFRANGSLG